ncbi:hypothetical protein [Nonomuraea typhae]|uniref:hypothetical protein n=1 Tax=Nonomuraea typhae TaxID=2603600 RepID=UPI0012FBEB6A|nr:hypothetical protein [Nonomuraea typhae]
MIGVPTGQLEFLEWETCHTSLIAFEGYDTVTVLAEVLPSRESWAPAGGSGPPARQTRILRTG